MIEYDKNKTSNFWDNKAQKYDDLYKDDINNYSPLHFRLEIVKKVIDKIMQHSKISDKPKCFDAGCGSGVLLDFLYKKDMFCSGCDLSKKMVKEAQKKFKDNKDVKIYNTSIDDLSMIKDNRFDIVFCLGVFPYVTEEDEKKAYSEMHRILKNKGFLISAHQNELFNLYSLNKHTLEFYDNYIDIFKECISESEFINIKLEISKLISNPNKPFKEEPRNKNEKTSAREYIFRKEENPLTFCKKLMNNGFKSFEFFYYNFHTMPPSTNYNILNSKQKITNEKIRDISKLLEIKKSQTWQAMFMCSSFINVAAKF